MKEIKTVNRILLGLLMLVPGVMKLLAVTGGNDYVSGMVGGIFLFAWAPTFWAWVLLLSEIIFGIAILANYKLKYTTIPPIFILLIAVLFVVVKWSAIATTPWTNLIFHLIAIVGYAGLMSEANK